MTEIITHQAVSLKKGGRLWTPDALLDRLADNRCPGFAEAVRAHLRQQEATTPL